MAKDDFDDFDDLDGFDDLFKDLDNETNTAKKKRSPLLELSRGFLDGVKSSLKDAVTDKYNQKEILDTADLKGFKGAVDFAHLIYEESNKLYNQAARDLKDPLSSLVKTIDKTIPENRTFLKRLTNKTKDVLGIYDSDYKPLSEEERNEQDIKDTVDQVFNSETSPMGEVAANARFQLEMKQAGLGNKILNSINANLSAMNAYNSRVNINYQRKSLELQTRALILQKKGIETQNILLTKLIAATTAIQLNTGLSDSEKVVNNKVHHRHTLAKFAAKRGYSLFSNSEFANRMKENLRNRLNEQIESFKYASSDIGDMAEQMKDASSMGMGMSPLFMLGAAATGMLPIDKVAGFLIGKGLKKYGSKNPKLKNLSDKAGIHFTDLEGSYNKAINKLGDKLNLSTEEMLNPGIKSGIKEILQNMLYNTNTSRVDLLLDKKDNGKNLLLPATFNLRTQKTITTIIPGYLARILQKVTQLNGEKADLLDFDHSHNRFISSKRVLADSRRQLSKNMDLRYTKYKMNENFGKLFNGLNLNENERKLIQRKIYSGMMSSKKIDRDFLTSEEFLKGLSPELASKFTTHVANNFGTDEGEYNLISKMTAVKQNIRDPRAYIEDMINNGQEGYLQKLGIIHRRGNSYKINKDALVDLIMKNTAQDRVHVHTGWDTLKTAGNVNISNIQQKANNLAGSVYNGSIRDKINNIVNATRSKIDNLVAKKNIAPNIKEQLLNLRKQLEASTTVASARNAVKRINNIANNISNTPTSNINRSFLFSTPNIGYNVSAYGANPAGYNPKLTTRIKTMEENKDNTLSQILENLVVFSKNFKEFSDHVVDVRVVSNSSIPGHEGEPTEKLLRPTEKESKSGSKSRLGRMKDSIKHAVTSPLTTLEGMLIGSGKKAISRSSKILSTYWNILTYGLNTVKRAANWINPLHIAANIGRGAWNVATMGSRALRSIGCAPEDIYTLEHTGKKVKAEPTLTKLGFVRGAYFNANGKVIENPCQIKGDVYDADSNVILTASEIKHVGIFNKHGKRIHPKSLMNRVLGFGPRMIGKTISNLVSNIGTVARGVGAVGSYALKGAGSVARGLIHTVGLAGEMGVHSTRLLANLVGLAKTPLEGVGHLFGLSSNISGKKSYGVLVEIRDILKRHFGENTDNKIKEVANTTKDKINSVKESMKDKYQRLRDKFKRDNNGPGVREELDDPGKLAFAKRWWRNSKNKANKAKEYVTNKIYKNQVKKKKSLGLLGMVGNLTHDATHLVGGLGKDALTGVKDFMLMKMLKKGLLRGKDGKPLKYVEKKSGGILNWIKGKLGFGGEAAGEDVGADAALDAGADTAGILATDTAAGSFIPGIGNIAGLGIGAATILAIKYHKQLEKALSPALKQMQPGLDDVGHSFGKLGGALGNAWHKAEPALASALNSALGGLAKVMKSFAKTVGSLSKNVIAPAISGIATAINFIANGDIGKDAYKAIHDTENSISKEWSSIKNTVEGNRSNKYYTKLDQTKDAPLGIKLNNPGYIKYWPSLPNATKVKGYIKFIDPEMGLMTLGATIKYYINKKYNTIAKLLPKLDLPMLTPKNTKEFLSRFCNQARIHPTQILNDKDETTIDRLITAIIIVGSGKMYYPPQLVTTVANVIAKGVVMDIFAKPTPSVKKAAAKVGVTMNKTQPKISKSMMDVEGVLKPKSKGKAKVINTGHTFMNSIKKGIADTLKDALAGLFGLGGAIASGIKTATVAAYKGIKYVGGVAEKYVLKGVKYATGDFEQVVKLVSFYGISGLTAFLESRGNPAAHSTGVGDNGGVSYGTFQLSSKTGGVQGFLGYIQNTQSGKSLINSGPVDSQAFINEWVKLATTDPKFNHMQALYNKVNYYDPIMNYLKQNGCDLSDKKLGVQCVLDRTANQWGPITGGQVVLTALHGKDPSKMTSDEVIKRIENHKLNHLNTEFRGCSPTEIQNVGRELVMEKEFGLKLNKASLTVSKSAANKPDEKSPKADPNIKAKVNKKKIEADAKAKTALSTKKPASVPKPADTKKASTALAPHAAITTSKALIPAKSAAIKSNFNQPVAKNTKTPIPVVQTTTHHHVVEMTHHVSGIHDVLKKSLEIQKKTAAELKDIKQILSNSNDLHKKISDITEQQSNNGDNPISSNPIKATDANYDRIPTKIPDPVVSVNRYNLNREKANSRW